MAKKIIATIASCLAVLLVLFLSLVLLFNYKGFFGDAITWLLVACVGILMAFTLYLMITRLVDIVKRRDHDEDLLDEKDIEEILNTESVRQRQTAVMAAVHLEKKDQAEDMPAEKPDWKEHPAKPRPETVGSAKAEAEKAPIVKSEEELAPAPKKPERQFLFKSKKAKQPSVAEMPEAPPIPEAPAIPAVPATPAVDREALRAAEAEAEARRRAEEVEKQRVEAEAKAKAMALAEEEARLRAEAEAAEAEREKERAALAEQEARQQAEAEARSRAEEEARQQALAAEEQARREQEEQQRLEEEERAEAERRKQQAIDSARRQAEAAAAARRRAAQRAAQTQSFAPITTESIPAFNNQVLENAGKVADSALWPLGKPPIKEEPAPAIEEPPVSPNDDIWTQMHVRQSAAPVLSSTRSLSEEEVLKAIEEQAAAAEAELAATTGHPAEKIAPEVNRKDQAWRPAKLPDAWHTAERPAIPGDMAYGSKLKPAEPAAPPPVPASVLPEAEPPRQPVADAPEEKQIVETVVSEVFEPPVEAPVEPEAFAPAQPEPLHTAEAAVEPMAEAVEPLPEPAAYQYPEADVADPGLTRVAEGLVTIPVAAEHTGPVDVPVEREDVRKHSTRAEQAERLAARTQVAKEAPAAEAKRPRGRPPKPKTEEELNAPKRPRGRPPKPKTEEELNAPKRPRGRPPKPKTEEELNAPKRPRGRPPKPKTEAELNAPKRPRGRPPKPKTEEELNAPKRPRGRPPKPKTEAELNAPKRPRGRPRKNPLPDGEGGSPAPKA